jgi:predicted lipid-binding transport protein (Tim44 family)
VGFLDRLLGRSGASAAHKEERGEDVASRLDALAQLDRKWSSEALRRRARDVFFAVQRSWIERDPEIGRPYMTGQLMDRQRLRIEGLIAQHRVHQFENPLIEDLDFVSFDEGDPNTVDEPRVTTALEISLVETILNADTGALVAGRANHKIQNAEYWTFVFRDGKWLLDEVEQPGEGARHMKAPLVGGDYAKLSPEMVLRERYARDEMTLEEFEAEMAKLLEKSDPTY